MDGFAIGLPNQALKPLVNTFTQDVQQTKPFERTHTTAALVAATETDVFATTAIETNRKVSIDSLILSATEEDTIFRLYRNGVLVGTYTVPAAITPVNVFSDGVGKEFDEAQTYRLTATSATGGGTATATASGRSVMKRDELFSQVIA